jgi:predicted acylesterase/phospholipase RssA
MTSSRRIAAVYAGGARRGAYQAGAHECLRESAALPPGWIAASSIGHGKDGLFVVRNRDSRMQRARPERSAWRVRHVGASR